VIRENIAIVLDVPLMIVGIFQVVLIVKVLLMTVNRRQICVFIRDQDIAVNFASALNARKILIVPNLTTVPNMMGRW
jgi:hypothetical protein